MAMRRIWVARTKHPNAVTEFMFEIMSGDDDMATPVVYDTFEEAQASVDETNADMAEAVRNGYLQDFDEMVVQDAWLVDETGNIHLVVECELGRLQIGDLQLYCEQNGQI